MARVKEGPRWHANGKCRDLAAVRRQLRVRAPRGLVYIPTQGMILGRWVAPKARVAIAALYKSPAWQHDVMCYRGSAELFPPATTDRAMVLKLWLVRVLAEHPLPVRAAPHHVPPPCADGSFAWQSGQTTPTFRMEQLNEMSAQLLLAVNRYIDKFEAGLAATTGLRHGPGLTRIWAFYSAADDEEELTEGDVDWRRGWERPSDYDYSNGVFQTGYELYPYLNPPPLPDSMRKAVAWLTTHISLRR